MRTLTRASVLGLVVYVGGISCASLPDIPAGTCGNRIVDPAEDCDTFPDPAAQTMCRRPGAPGECRFDCSIDPMTSARRKCPAGWGCGTDAICRAPRGEFATSGSSIAREAYAVTMADFDGDGLKDVLATGVVDLKVYYGDPTGSLGSSFTIPAVFAQPAVGHMTTSPRADLVFPVYPQIAVWRGQPARTFAPTLYPSFALAGDLPTALFGVERANPKKAGTNTLFFIPDAVGTNVIAFDDGVVGSDPPVQTRYSLFTFTQNAFALAGRVVVGNFLEDRPLRPSSCEDFALAFTGDSAVQVMTPCNKNEINSEGPLQLKLPDVRFPGMRVTSGFQTADLNRDGHLDLVIDAQDAAGIGRTLLAYGTGDGTFNSTAVIVGPPDSAAKEDLNVVPRDPTCPANLVDVNCNYPLAVGQLTRADNVPDLIYTNVIVVRTGTSPATTIASPFQTLWTEAHVVDLNGDGVPDVIAAGRRSIDVYTGTGTGTFAHTTYSLAGAAANLTFGDVDGDFLPDVVYSEESAMGGETLFILYGRYLAAPEPPARVGGVGLVEQIVCGVPAGQTVSLAGIDVLSRSTDMKTQHVTVLPGSTNRVLESPFDLSRPLADGSYKPGFSFAAGVGHFTSALKNGERTLHNDVAIIGGEASADGKKTELRLWLTPSSGEALLDQATTTASTQTLETIDAARDAAYDWYAAKALPIDLNPPGTMPSTDSLVVFVKPVAPMGTGKLIVAKVVDGLFNPAIQFPLGGASRDDSQLAVADVNGDGADDLIVMVDAPTGRTLQVFWNRRNGTLDPKAVAVVTLPDGASTMMGFAALHVGAGLAKELVLLTRSSGVFVAKINAAGDSFTVSNTNVPNLPSGSDIAAGDANGDGVDDLIILNIDDTGMELFLGVPVLR